MKLIKFLALVGTIALVTTNRVNAQEAPSANVKLNSIGPAIEFGGGGTSFGIKGKIGVGQQFSIRPTILFGYKPSVSGSDILKGSITNDGSSTQNGLPVTVPISTVINTNGLDPQALGDVGSGIGYGLAITYDLKSPDGKIQGYIGPSILFGSASRSNNATNGIPFATNVSETNIGLTTGADFAISPDFTAGLNATYNFSRSGTFSATAPGGTSISAPLSGGNFKFGVNFGYNF